VYVLSGLNAMTIIDVFRTVRGLIEPVLGNKGYTFRSAGTKSPKLEVPLNLNSGYWQNPQEVSSKPPRWIVHLKFEASKLIASPAKQESGDKFGSSDTPGYLNNRDGKCTAVFIRLMPAIKRNASSTSDYLFPEGWEWGLILVFPKPLPSGSSSEILSNFDPSSNQITYKEKVYKLAGIGLIKTHPEIKQVSTDLGDITYDDASQALINFLSSEEVKAQIYDTSKTEDLEKLKADLQKSQDDEFLVPIDVSPSPNLIGISPEVYLLVKASLAIGKRNFIFYGPPGTGKTTLAQYVASLISEEDENSEDVPYILLTASSSWSSQDLVGGYQPMGGGKIAFIPGVMLREFDKPIIIDELNRCPIDKVVGPLFSILSGQSTTLPYRTEVENKDSEAYKILPLPKNSPEAYEYAPGQNWALICTLNVMDKSQLGQISYALARRFTWIRVGVPTDLNSFVHEILKSKNLLKDTSDMSLNPVADMWKIINGVREIGGAPIIDLIQIASKMDSSIDFLQKPSVPTCKILLTALGATILPLMDGIRRSEAEIIIEKMKLIWDLNNEQEDLLKQNLMELAL
jgi:MoxR-like ATPase